MLTVCFPVLRIQHYTAYRMILANISGTQQIPLRVKILSLKLLNHNFTVNCESLIVNALVLSAVSVNGLLGLSKSGLL